MPPALLHPARRNSPKPIVQIELGPQRLGDLAQAARGQNEKRDRQPCHRCHIGGMRSQLIQAHRVLAPGRRAFYVVGNGRTRAGEQWVVIDTCRHLTEIGIMAGLRHVESIGIDVTTENHRMHGRNAITRNSILVFEKPG